MTISNKKYIDITSTVSAKSVETSDSVIVVSTENLIDEQDNNFTDEQDNNFIFE